METVVYLLLTEDFSEGARLYFDIGEAAAAAKIIQESRKDLDYTITRVTLTRDTQGKTVERRELVWSRTITGNFNLTFGDAF